MPALMRTEADIWVADSASTDGSMEMMAEEFPTVRTIQLDGNYGFTGGYNRAMSEVIAKGEYSYLVLINSDVEVPEGWLKPLEQWMDRHADCGVCGPKILAMGEDFSRTSRFEYAGAAGGCLDRFGYPFCRGRVPGRTEDDMEQYQSPADVLWISGACMMTRVSLWQELGGLDERFFAHMEEIDYCWRAQLAGWKVTVVPDSKVWHLGGGTLPQKSALKLKLNFRNNILLLENNLASTFRASGYSPEKSSAKARRRISARKFLDLCSAAVYLLSGRKSCFDAVMKARTECRALGGMKDPVSSGHLPSGLYELNIIPLSVIKGKNIFKYLREYENCHFRCR